MRHPNLSQRRRRQSDAVIIARWLWMAALLFLLDLPSSVALRRPFLQSSKKPLVGCSVLSVIGDCGSYRSGVGTTRISRSSCLETSAFGIRGGASSSTEEEEEGEIDDDEEPLDDLEDVFDEFELGDEADEDDFSEQPMVDRAIDAYHKTPPLTKGYLTASATTTGLGWAIDRSQLPRILLLDWKQTLTKGQFWRPLTTFLNFGPLGLGYFLTVHFVWTYMSTLERLHHRKPYEFWIMISFGMMSMVFGYPILKLNARFLGHNLSTFLVYMWSRYHEGLQVKMFEVHTTRAELLPWYFLLQVRERDVREVTFGMLPCGGVEDARQLTQHSCFHFLLLSLVDISAGRGTARIGLFGNCVRTHLLLL